MKGYEIALKAVDEIVSAINEIQGYSSEGEECVIGNSDEIISFENGEITVPTKFLNKEIGMRMYITLKVNVEYL